MKSHCINYGAQASSLHCGPQASCLRAGWKPAALYAGKMPALLCFALLLAFGCRSAAPASHSRDTLVIAVDSSPTNLDPRIGIDKASEDFHHLLFNGLLRRNDQNRMVPDLAESFEKVSPTLYRFRLRKDVRFHNGKSLNAADVVFTYQSILNGAIITTKKAALRSIHSVRAVDSANVEMQLSEPFNGLLSNLNLAIVPKGSGADFSQNPIGTGPYRLRDIRADSFATLESFPQYFEGAPKIRYVKIRIIPDATTRALELRKGSVDLLMGVAVVPPDTLRVLKKVPNLKTLFSPGSNYAYVGINLRDPILSDRRVRQAIAFAIHRESMITSLFQGGALPATGLLPPYHWAYEKNVLSIAYDPAKAKQILDAAGYRDPDGDGPQKRFWLTLKVSMNEFRRVIATVIQSDLEKVGIGVRLRSYEWSTFFSDINRGNFQLCMLMWVGETDPDLYREIFSTKGARNRGKYVDPQLDDWVERARTVPTEQEQRYYYSLVQKKVAEDCPYVSLWFESNVALMRKELGGLRLTPDVSTRALKDVYWMW